MCTNTSWSCDPKNLIRVRVFSLSLMRYHYLLWCFHFQKINKTSTPLILWSHTPFKKANYSLNENDDVGIQIQNIILIFILKVKLFKKWKKIHFEDNNPVSIDKFNMYSTGLAPSLSLGNFVIIVAFGVCLVA